MRMLLHEIYVQLTLDQLRACLLVPQSGYVATPSERCVKTRNLIRNLVHYECLLNI